MSKYLELQGMSVEDFNHLMYRLSIYSPEWAKYIKKYMNKKQKNSCDVHGDICEYTRYDCNRRESFDVKDQTYNLGNACCCIVGEANYIIDKKIRHYCSKCSYYSIELLNNDTIKDKDKFKTSIVILKTLKNFIEHKEREP